MPAASDNLSERSYRYIKQQMQNGALSPGARLVNRKLADEIGVSVIPVREAIRQLSSEGLVDHVPGSGAFVRQANRADLDELYVLRDAVESCAAAEAAQYITPQQLEDLEEVLAESRKVAAAVAENSTGHATATLFDRWIDLEEEFHQILVEACRNRLLSKVIQDHRVITAVFETQRNSAEMLTAEAAALTCDGKTSLVEALRNRDSELARELMSKQIQRGRRMVLSFFRKQERAH